MPFTGNENHDIDLSAAAALTTQFRNAHPTALVNGFYFSRDSIQNILNQPGCVGIRIYYGEDPMANPKLVLVGADMNQDDLVNGLLAQHGQPCPPFNSSPNPLNT